MSVADAQDGGIDATRAGELEALRPVLLRVARLHLRNAAWAEDAVSETLLAAPESRTVFAARSTLQTWVIGILRHKIIDTFRVRRREEPLADDEDDARLEEGIFQPDGHYREMPQAWVTPESQLSRNQFLEILETCVQKLPPAQARIFLMREWLELSTVEICNEMSISATNAGVLLHRARLRLRECLQIHWFGEAPS